MNKNKSDLLYTFFTQITLTIFNIILLKLFSYNYLEEDFGCYLVIRRIIGLIFPILLINLNLSLARNISQDNQKSDSFLVIGIIILTISTFFIFILIMFFNSFFAKILFGSVDYNYLLLPTSLFMFSNCFQILVTGFFRGKHNFKKMNLSMLLIFGIQVALLLFSFALNIKLSIPNFLYLSSFFIFLIYFLLFIRDFHVSKIKYIDIKTNIKLNSEFMRYGIHRIPNGFFLGGIYSIPVIFTTNFISIKQAAYVGVIVSIFRMLQQVGYPLNMLFVPKFSKHLFDNNLVIIKKQIEAILDMLFTFPILIGAFLSFLAPELILFWFGEKYMIIVPYLVYFSPAVILILAYILIRGILDGLYTFPYSNVITFSGFFTTIFILILTYFLKLDLPGIIASFIIGISICGVVSIYIICNSLKIKFINNKKIIGVLWGTGIYFLLFSVSDYDIENQIISFSIKLIISLFVLIGSYYFYSKNGYFNLLNKKRTDNNE